MGPSRQSAMRGVVDNVPLTVVHEKVVIGVDANPGLTRRALFDEVNVGARMMPFR